MTRKVRERFPEWEDEIVGLYEHNPEFRGLCHDVGVCLEEIERLTKSAASAGRDQRLAQFHELKRELEADIVEQLNSAFTRPPVILNTQKEGKAVPETNNATRREFLTATGAATAAVAIGAQRYDEAQPRRKNSCPITNP